MQCNFNNYWVLMWLIFPYLSLLYWKSLFKKNNASINNKVLLPNVKESKLIFLRHWYFMADEGGHSIGMSEHCSIFFGIVHCRIHWKIVWVLFRNYGESTRVKSCLFTWLNLSYDFGNRSINGVRQCKRKDSALSIGIRWSWLLWTFVIVNSSLKHFKGVGDMTVCLVVQIFCF